MSESLDDVTKIIDKMVEEFKYVSDLCLDLVDILPKEITDEFQKRINNVNEIYNSYWMERIK